METLDYTPDIEYPSSSATMQFTAYTSPSAGLYTDTRDTGGRQKLFTWMPRPENSLGLHVEHQYPRTDRSTVEPAYPTVFGAIQGDWHDAVNRYTDWLTSAGWLSDVPPEQPDWIGDVGVTFKDTSYWRDGFAERFDEQDRSYAATLESANTLRTALDTPFNLLQSGWQKHGYPGVGDWFPPTEGTEGLRAHIEGAAAAEMPMTLFYNPTFISEQSDLWQSQAETAKKWILKEPDGSLSTGETDLSGTVYNVEVTHEDYRQRVKEIVTTVTEMGAREIWIDGEPHGANRVCYDSNHDHPPGPGAWYPRELRALFNELDSAITDEAAGTLLSGEGISDFLLPYQTISNTKDVKAEVQGQSVIRPEVSIIPLVEYGLGQYTSTRFQNGEDPVRGSELSKELMRVMWARTLVFGTMPWLHVLGDPESDKYYQDLLSYIGRIGDARTSWGQRFVNTGRMLRTPNVQTSQFSFTEDIVGQELSFDRIRASSWESDRGERAILLTNASPESVETTITRDGQPFDLSSNSISYAVHDGTYELLGTQEVLEEVSLRLEPNAITLLVFAPPAEGQLSALETLIEAQNSEQVPLDSSLLTDAKRAFEAGEYSTVEELAEKALSPSTETSSPTSSQTATSRSTVTKSTTRTTSVDSPGFDLAASITSMIAALAALYRQLSESDDE
ncbi:DUF6259 domain-containing protein [Halobaculum sp. EA56]|uniref:DUF6259 domain-containing protein n=1 Tax=Halobaculum sp. EA56 TaxID=3421648 RepID=UPI003EC0E498